MSTVDERIVNMKIDNQQLLSGVKSTQLALDQLNKAVGNTSNAKGMDGLGGSVDGVKSKFSALNVAAMTVVGTITNKLVNAGIGLVKSLTIDPIKQGFQEYETNLNSIQTIMANTGKKVGVVNKYLDELNTYSDKTIYNFSEMARNIGTFTAAGVDLKTSVASIKGIANLAALSGSNSQQAATAMYQLSQGIAAGKIGLQDWNSVVNAGMGGKTFQKALATTASVMGELEKGAVKSVGPMKKLMVRGSSFRESIMAKPGHSSWLSAEVLTTTLKTFTGDMTRAQLASEGFNKEQIKGILKTAKAAQDAATKVKTFTQLVDVVKESIGSGIAGIFQNLFGTFTEAKKLWTGVADVVTGKISAFFDSIDKALFQWRQLGGYKMLWEAIGNIFQALGNIMQPFLDAIGMILPKSKNAGTGLAALTEGFLHFSEWLEKVTRGTSVLGPVFEVLGLVFGAVLAVVVGVVKYFAMLIPLVSGLTSGIASLLTDVGMLATQFLEWADIAGRVQTLFNTIIQGREAALKPILDTIGAIVAAFGLLFKGDVSGFQTSFKSALALLDPLIAKIQGFATQAQNFFTGMELKSGNTLGAIGGHLSVVAGKIRDFTDSIRDAFKSFSDAGAQAATTKMSAVSSSAEGTVSALKLVGGWIWTAVKWIGKGLAWLGEKVAELFSGMDKYDFMTVFSFLVNGAFFLMIKRFLDKMSSGTEVLSSVEGAFERLTKTLKTMQTAVRANIIKTIAISVGILAASLWLISRVPAEDLGRSLGAIGLMLGSLVGVMALLGKGKLGEFASKNLLGVGAAMVLLSVALLNLAGAVAIFGNMEPETLKKGLVSIAIALTILTVAAVAMQKVQGAILAAAAAMVLMAFGLQALAAAIFLYSKFDPEEFKSGLIKMGSALAVVVLAMNGLRGAGKSMLAGAVAFMIIAAAMNVLALALKQFAAIEDTSKALWTLGISLGILVAAVNLMNGAVGGALALAVVASSIIVLAGALKMMSEMDIPSLAKALGALAIALAIFLAAGALATVVAGGLLVLGAAIIMIGAGLALAGVGLVMFAAGLATLVGLGTAAFMVVQGAIQVFLAMLPMMAVQLAAAFVSFMRAMADAAPKIGKSFEKLITEMIKTAERLLPKIDRLVNKWLDTSLKTIQRNAPKFGKTFRVLVDEGLKVLEYNIPRFARAGYRIILGLIEAADKYVPRITRVAGNLIVDFINELSNNTQKIVRAGANFIIKLINGISEESGRIANAAGAAIVKFLVGLRQAVDRYAPQIREEGRKLAYSIADGMTGGLASKAGEVAGKARSLASSALSAIHGAIKNPPYPSREGIAIGQSIGIGMARGIEGATKVAADASTEMGLATINSAKVALDSHSPSKVFKELGIGVSAGFAAGIQSSLSLVASAGSKMAGYAIDTVSRTVSAMQFRASALLAKARAYGKAADAANKRAQQKGASKAEKARSKAEAKKLNKTAKAASRASQRAQKAADEEAAVIDREREFANADASGKSDILRTEAEEAAKAAAVQRENAIALAKEAELIRKKDRKRAAALARAANAALANAEKAARKAESKAAEAAQWSAEAVLASANEISSQIQAEKDEVALQARLKGMSSAEKAEYYKTESERAQAESDAKYAEAEALLAKAKAEAGTNAIQAQKDVEAAKIAVEAASAAKQKADNYLSELESLTGSPDGGSSGGTGSTFDPANFTMPDTTIASSLVYGAQNMFDAYSKALAATANAASADKAPSVQFVQNNTSPVALSPTEIYRQSKNLLSDAERKLTGALT